VWWKTPGRRNIVLLEASELNHIRHDEAEHPSDIHQQTILPARSVHKHFVSQRPAAFG
jgi:hypothetical protein